MRTHASLYCYAIALFVITCQFPDVLSVSTPLPDVCTWKTEMDAYSMIYKTCLRLSSKPCHCVKKSCDKGSVVYNVTKISPEYKCENVITWCSWGSWTSRSFAIRSNDCVRVSVRRRYCCVELWNQYRRYGSIETNGVQWSCPGTNENKHSFKYPCSNLGAAAVLPLSLFAVVICILIFITCVLLVRILCGTKLAVCCRRAVGIMHTHRRNDAMVEPYAPPSYDDAIANSATLPSYTEAISSSMQLDTIPSANLPSEDVSQDVARPQEVSDSVHETSEGNLNQTSNVDETIEEPLQQTVVVSSGPENAIYSNGKREGMNDNSIDDSPTEDGSSEPVNSGNSCASS